MPIYALPPGWNQPTPAMQAAIDEASGEFEVPSDLLYAMIAKESNFNPKALGRKHAGNSEGFAKSYQTWAGIRIPGSQMTWGQMFKPEQWRPYGLTQLLPFNLVGKKLGQDDAVSVKAGASISALFEPRANIRAAAELLKRLYERSGSDSWGKALKLYNGSGAYAREVAANIDKLKAAQAAA